MKDPSHPLRPLLRSLRHHWRTHLAVVLCVMAGGAALTGALLVGDSMRGSLRDRALGRLGPVDQALLAPRFFGERLAADLAGDPDLPASPGGLCPAILLRGGIHHATSGARVNRIDVLGVDDRFARLFGAEGMLRMARSGRSIALSRSLAESLDAQVGDDVLVRVGRPGEIPVESVLGRREQTAASIRLTLAGIVPDEGIGGFGLRPDQFAPRNAFIPLATLQKALGQAGRVNVLLAACGEEGPAPDDTRDAQVRNERLAAALARHVRLEDYGLRVRREAARGIFALETNRLLLEPPIEAAALKAAGAVRRRAMPVLTYLANTIARLPRGGADEGVREIPYSTISAVASVPGGAALGAEEILLNRWAADDLGAEPGDRIEIEYYVARRGGGLETRTARFRLAGVLPMRGWSADPGFMPPYPGISDAETLADWDPPASFRIDLRRIREQDERYWKDHRGTPKAFVALETGRRLWTDADRRFGRSTAIFFSAGPGEALDAAAAAFERALLAHLDPARLGLVFEPVRVQALRAASGSTDFSQLFIAFSFFIIAAAAMLVALVFRLGVERRAPEIGLLLATGYAPKRVARRFLLEGALLADAGSFLGLLAAVGHAALMLAGLRSADWWAGAVNAPFLRLHLSVGSLVIGYLANLAIALGSIAWSIRGLTRLPPRALLAGAIQSGRAGAAGRRGRWVTAVFVGSLILGLGVLGSALATDAVPEVPAFFGGGAAMLIAGLSGAGLWLGRDRRAVIRTGGGAIVRLGIRNATRHRGRSLTTAALIACSAFVIVAVGASRHGMGESALARHGGTGGYALMGEAALPLPYDLNTPAGRDALNLSEKTAGLLAGARVTALRLKPGEDTSCLNLYRVSRPKILGIPAGMIERGGFAFARSTARTAAEKANPWRLLNRSFEVGAVPMIGDANTLTYLLKLGLGDTFVLNDERGRKRRLRVVGMLAGSVLQGELLIAEERFIELFPSVAGYGFVLIDVPPASVDGLARALERELGGFGLDVESTLERLNAYRGVENTYMSTFQTLGGLGLILGTLGLGAVMLRNVFERRGELALLRALGFRQTRLAWMVLAENAALLLGGVLIGGLSALLATAPHASERPDEVPWVSLSATLLGVTAVGLVAGAGALAASLRTPLLPALRSE